MGLFSKEADGRLPKRALYRIVKKELGLINDFYFTDVIKESWMPYRWKVAAFQMYAFWAVQEGDEAVARLYSEAAEELGLMVKTIKESLVFSSDKICVTYSGGLFQVGDLILQPFREEIERLAAYWRSRSGLQRKAPSCWRKNTASQCLWHTRTKAR